MRNAIFFLSRSFSNGSSAISKPLKSFHPYQRLIAQATQPRLAALLTIALWLSPQRTHAANIGCWWKSGEIQPHLHKTCDFYLYKKGIFSTQGKLKIVNGETKQDYFWVTHRMSPNEKLTEAAGQKLGAALNAFVGKAKFIELDIEPVKDPKTLLEFLKGVRENLSSELKLTIAAPFTSEKKSTATSWTLAQFEQVFVWVDGLELMVYDTGAQTKEEYLQHFENNLAAARSWQKRYPSKQFVVGLPAYPDKTKLHRPAIENLATINESTAVGNVDGKTPFALYAGWTIGPEDFKQLEILRTRLRPERKR